MFNLTLVPQGDGWLQAEVIVGTTLQSFQASYLGHDLCAGLVRVAEGLHKSERLHNEGGGFLGEVLLYGEPEGITLYFTVEEGATVVRLYYSKDVDSLPKGQYGDCLAKYECNQNEIIEAIYRILRDLLVAHGHELLSADWQEFPSGAFVALHRALHKEPKIVGEGLRAEANLFLNICR